MENNEGYDGGQKRDRIYYLNTRIDARDQDILSCGVSTTALEHDYGRRTAVVYCSNQ